MFHYVLHLLHLWQCAEQRTAKKMRVFTPPPGPPDGGEDGSGLSRQTGHIRPRN